jgi:hypothetical protein
VENGANMDEQKLDRIKIKLTATSECTELEQKEVYTSHKTLGTHKCLVGKEVEQYKQLFEKSEKYVL